MKKLLIALSLLAAPLAGCTTTQLLQGAPVIGNVCSAADRTLIDEKAVFAAQTLYNIPADAYKRAYKAGNLVPHSDLQIKLRNMLMRLDLMRVTIRDAKGAINCDFAAMQRLHTEILTLIPRK